MPFTKGHSGNPAGRTPGSGIAGTIRKAINDRAPELLQVVIDKALNEGDATAALALLNKVVPNLKASNEPVQFNLDTGNRLSQTGEQILQSIATGDIVLDSGTQILGSLAALSKMKEIDEIISRLEKLEANV